MSVDNDTPNAATRGMTPNEVARILRVNSDRVRAWIRNGELGAVNTAPTRCGKPRFVVLPHHLAEFEKRRAAAEPPAPKRKKRRKQSDFIDYFPD
jgi:excisionase family DNA binding protein